MRLNGYRIDFCIWTILDGFSLPFREDTRVVNPKNQVPRLILKLDILPRLDLAHEDFANFANLFFAFRDQTTRSHTMSG